MCNYDKKILNESVQMADEKFPHVMIQGGLRCKPPKNEKIKRGHVLMTQKDLK